MSFGNSQVVGVVQLEPANSGQDEHPLAPSHRAHRQKASPALAQFVAASDDDDVITADVRQLKRELRAELAFVLSRLRRRSAQPA